MSTRTRVVGLACLSCLLSVSAAHAEDDLPLPTRRPDGLSFGLFTGLRPDMAALGEALLQDGVLELGQGNALRAFGGTKNFLMSESDDDILFYASKTTSSQWKFLNARKSSGALTGVTVGVDVRYELHRHGLPLFARVGVDYSFRVIGGDHERVLGPAIDTATPFGAAIKDVTGGTEGGVLKTSARAAWFEAPVTIGFSIPLGHHGHKVYAGAGVSYFNGNFSITFDADARYIRAATTFTDGARVYGPLLNDAVKTKAQFDYAGLGPNFVLGAEARLADRSAVFLEFVGSGVAATVYSNDLGEGGRQVLTLLNSNPAGGVLLPHADDPQLFKRFAYPVVLGGAYFRLGYRFYAL